MSKAASQYTSVEDLPSKPKRPQTGFFIYKSEVFAKRRTECPNLKVPEIVSKISEEYKALPEKEKQKYEEAYRKEKAVYDKQNDAWKEKYGDIEKQLKDQAKKALKEKTKKSKAAEKEAEKSKKKAPAVAIVKKDDKKAPAKKK